jgi:hypothetical protein
VAAAFVAFRWSRRADEPASNAADMHDNPELRARLDDELRDLE